VSCYHPLPAYVGRAGGSPVIGYMPGSRRWDGKKTHGDFDGEKMELPCGRCIGCRLDRSAAWSVRMMHEAQLHDSNLFVTLDYAPEHLPASLSLEYRDFQLFMKRLRHEVGRVRFFVSGEYGEQFTQRPHWHAILFGCRFPDAVRYLNGTSRSLLAETLWSKGQVVIGELTPASAAYVAGYTLSKAFGREAYDDVVNLRTGEITSRRPPFCRMSLKPGIGSQWYAEFKRDLFPADSAVVDGHKRKVPSYYWRKFKEDGPSSLVEQIEYGRYLKAKEVPIEESSERRREDREAVARAKFLLRGPRQKGGM